MKRLTILAVSGAFLASAADMTVRAENIQFKNCRTSEKLSIGLTYQEQQAIDMHARPSLIGEASAGSGNAVYLLASGPVLGSMDSREIAFETVCASGNIHVTATVTRASGYGGAVLKFTTWRPLIRFDLPLATRKRRVTLTWRMVSSSGAELNEGGLPTGFTQPFPITLTHGVP